MAAARKRTYRMVARAEAAERTSARVFEAAGGLFAERPFDEVTLRAVADRAGVSLQTVIRKFGSKEALFEAASPSLLEAVMTSRAPTRPCEVGAAIEALVASYDRMGNLGWRGLTQEDRFPWIKRQMDGARAAHRAWVERTFSHLLPRRAGPQRERKILLLFAATDFYVWKLFRRDLALGRQATVARMVDLVQSVAGG